MLSKYVTDNQEDYTWVKHIYFNFVLWEKNELTTGLVVHAYID
jgi:hypothetical protein